MDTLFWSADGLSADGWGALLVCRRLGSVALFVIVVCCSICYCGVLLYLLLWRVALFVIVACCSICYYGVLFCYCDALEMRLKIVFSYISLFCLFYTLLYTLLYTHLFARYHSHLHLNLIFSFVQV